MGVISTATLLPNTTTSWQHSIPFITLVSFVMLLFILALCTLCFYRDRDTLSVCSGSTNGDNDSVSKAPLLTNEDSTDGDFHFTLNKHKSYIQKGTKTLKNISRKISTVRKKSVIVAHRIIDIGNPPTSKKNYTVRIAQPGVGGKRRSVESEDSDTSSATLVAPAPDVPPASESCSDPNEDIGSLYFNVSYCVDSLTLKLTIQRAVNLPAKDMNGSTDPFVRILLRPDKKHKLETKVKWKNRNPVWNEAFTFEDFSWPRLQRRTLYLQVLDYDRFSRNDPIGETELSLSDYKFSEEPAMFVKKLDPCKHSCSHNIHGDLLISMCYEPQHGEDVSRITITVMKALNMKCVDITGVCDPYVKAYLMDGDKRLAKKKTTIKRRAMTPVWNEKLVFAVSPRGLRELSFVLSVVDWDRVLPNEVIGQLIIGYRTSGTSLKHWTDMMDHPRKTIAMWHKIVR